MAHRHQLDTSPRKFDCPSCGARRRFTRYIDLSTSEYIADHVGRCDRENSCGHHVTPRMYFDQHGGPEPAKDWTPPPPPPPKPLWVHAEVDVEATIQGVHRLPLLRYFMAQPAIDAAILQETVREYQVGRWNAPGDIHHGALVAWQRDAQGRVRAGHLIPFGEDGHRQKPDRWGHWAHKVIHRRSASDLGVRWCLFGEHLLPRYPDAVVMVVESEKTALGMACLKPYVGGRRALWVATAGKDGFGDRLLALRGREVMAWPDASPTGDAYTKWRAVAERLDPAVTIRVMDTLEHVPQELRAAGVDILDLYIDHGQARPLSGEGARLKKILQRYPTAGALVLELATIKP